METRNKQLLGKEAGVKQDSPHPAERLMYWDQVRFFLEARHNVTLPSNVSHSLIDGHHLPVRGQGNHLIL